MKREIYLAELQFNTDGRSWANQSFVRKYFSLKYFAKFCIPLMGRVENHGCAWSVVTAYNPFSLVIFFIGVIEEGGSLKNNHPHSVFVFG